MPKKFILTLVVFVAVGALVFVTSWAFNTQGIALPAPITEETLCPVAGCTQPDKGCHAAQAAPEPDGSFTMICPRVKGCADSTCHAWERIDAPRSKPSDASMNLWILAPVILVLGLMGLTRKLS
ncbi:MAG: hypothetical protein LBI64_06730 [Coriobacteriales bacterium]|jgi:hypothetical protein|nr:hypothetical protein [Coriobacteriales bacterium]